MCGIGRDRGAAAARWGVGVRAVNLEAVLFLTQPGGVDVDRVFIGVVVAGGHRVAGDSRRQGGEPVDILTDKRGVVDGGRADDRRGVGGVTRVQR